MTASGAAPDTDGRTQPAAGNGSPGFDAAAWQQSWDRQQEGYLPDREERFATMLDAVVAINEDAPPRILDLAGGTGSISLRALARFPRASTTVLDVDPVLLAIALASLDERTTFVNADLRSPDWAHALDGAQYDAVLTATALHWIQPARLAELYREIRDVLRPGGLFANADHMPDPGLPSLGPRLTLMNEHRHAAAARAGAVLDWDSWWEKLAEEPALADLLPQRAAVFADRHPVEVEPDVAWHLDALRAAGFGEVGVLWRAGNDAAIAALR